MVKTEDLIRHNLQRIRQDSKMRQSDVAKALGVSVQAVRNWENGRRQASYAVIDKLCALYQVPATELLIDKHAIIPDDIMEALLRYPLRIADYDIISDFISHLWYLNTERN